MLAHVRELELPPEIALQGAQRGLMPLQRFGFVSKNAHLLHIGRNGLLDGDPGTETFSFSALSQKCHIRGDTASTRNGEGCEKEIHQNQTKLSKPNALPLRGSFLLTTEKTMLWLWLA
jgi:hypothetical protein